MYYNYREKGAPFFSEVPPVQITFDEGCLGWGTLVVDSDNNVHAWYDNSRRMEYRMNDGSGWSDPEEIPYYDSEKGGNQGMCSAAIDAEDNLYVIYKDASTPNGTGNAWDNDMDVFCGTNKSGEWLYVNVTRLDASQPLNYPDIAREVLEDGVVHMVYTLYTDNVTDDDLDPATQVIYERAYPWPPEPTCSVNQLSDTYMTSATIKITGSTEDIDGVVVGCKLFVMKNGESIGEYDMTELEQDKYESEVTFEGVVGDTISYYGQALDNDGHTGDSPLLRFVVTEPRNPNVDLLIVRDDEKLVTEFWTPLMDCVKTDSGEKYNFEVWDISDHKGIDASVTNFGWKTIFIHGWVIESVPTRAYEGDGYAAFLNAGTEAEPTNLCLVSQDYFYGAGETGGVDLAFEPGDFAYDFFQIAGGMSDPDVDGAAPDSVLLGNFDDPISGSFAEEPLYLRHDISGQQQYLDYTSAVDPANDIFLLYNMGYGSGVRYDGGTFKTIHLPWLMCDLVKYVDAENGDSTIVPQDDAFVLMENILHWFGTEAGEALPSAVDDKPEALVNKFDLAQNYPNPFNPITHIDYAVPKTAQVEISVFNSLGQKIKTLVNGKASAGLHTVQWDGTDEMGSVVSSGIYFYQIKADNFTKTHKMLMMK
ncbi:T9SS type A sorting domain-containing protein [candidate division KSB1 bacterium]|nr:T9SS type A sorting domain-containing protein [candidate division KSB1 bacterium]